jgi:hypothetical protein
MSDPLFVGDQTPRFFDQNSAVHFFIRMIGRNGVESKSARVPIMSTKGYPLIEDLLCDLEILPLEPPKDIKTLQREVSIDALVEFGTVFDDYGIVAHAGKSPMDKPIAKVVFGPDKTRYYAHPHIRRMVKRINKLENDSITN